MRSLKISIALGLLFSFTVTPVQALNTQEAYTTPPDLTVESKAFPSVHVGTTALDDSFKVSTQTGAKRAVASEESTETDSTVEVKDRTPASAPPTEVQPWKWSDVDN